MKATRKQIAEANRIAARFGGWREPEEIRAMYEALEAVGITTGVITNRRDFPNLGCWQGSCEWYINGEEVENSRCGGRGNPKERTNSGANRLMI